MQLLDLQKDASLAGTGWCRCAHLAQRRSRPRRVPVCNAQDQASVLPLLWRESVRSRHGRSRRSILCRVPFGTRRHPRGAPGRPAGFVFQRPTRRLRRAAERYFSAVKPETLAGEGRGGEAWSQPAALPRARRSARVARAAMPPRRPKAQDGGSAGFGPAALDTGAAPC